MSQPCYHAYADHECLAEMKLLLLVVSFLLGIHATGAGVVSAVNAVLRDWEAAPYELLQLHQGFEERRYPARRWITTSDEGEERDPLMSPMFLRLFAYIGGANDRNMTMNMTTPVTTLVQPGASGHAYTMAFFVPEDMQAEALAGAEDVVVEDRPEMTVLTRRFSGYATDAVVANETLELQHIITASGQVGVDYSSYYVVVYDPPFKFFNRRNEIWYLKTASTSA